MRSVLTLFVLFASLMLVIPTTAAAVLKNGVEKTDMPSAAVSQSAEERIESEKAGPLENIEEKAELFSEFLILDRSSGKTQTVSAIDFIRGAVSSEMPAAYDIEALKAQAVAAHTWAVKCALSPDKALGGAHFSADPTKDEGYITKARFFERYGDTADEYWDKICEAADFAANRLVIYDGEPALCAYHAMSAGVTEDAGNVWQTSLPYLVPVESGGDIESDTFEETKTFGTAEMRMLLSLSFPTAILQEDPAEWIEINERSASGYVTQVTVGGVEMHGQKLRTALSLRSTALTLDYKEGVFYITTKGYGHGVGLSQVGANAMAQEGADAEEILSHYYPDTELVEY
ncbi:MAG: stage II sporulation protein D [Oscillospiraceae bacterium]|nr:stage II sporulation protein D [Oscillospiraceae bacterium]